MDAVRFGRALGFGARQAAKTVVRAVDAARADNPSPPPTPSSDQPRPDAVTAVTPRAASGLVSNAPLANRPVRAATLPVTAQRPSQIPSASVGSVREGLNRFRKSAVEPAVRLSSVLWLEVTGVFFALFALGAASGFWRLRAELRATFTHPVAHAAVLATAIIFIMFAYFSASSFLRAYRRQRHPQRRPPRRPR